MNTDTIIRATEKLYTLTKRLSYAEDRDGCRADIIDTFKAMATDLGKLAVPELMPDWLRVHLASMDLHSAALQAEASRIGTFNQAGCEAALSMSLISLAANLGFIIEDADDDAAMAHVEGARLEAAE